MDERTREAVGLLRGRIPETPEAGLVLGSGLGDLAGEVEDAVRIPYAEIPDFPVPTVPGHAGQLVAGRLEGVPVAVLRGRFHLYEGYTARQAAYPVRVLAALGVRTLLVTNAAGGVRRGFHPGTLMLISDHINLTSRSPLTGPVVGGEPRFPDMSDPYDRGLRAMARSVALAGRLPLEEGVYAAVQGPSYETPAEIRMLERMGADAVGMSTVPEVLAARAAGLRVMGVSCITNLAAGLGTEPLSHDDVVREGARVRRAFTRLLRGILARMAAREGGLPR